MAVLSRSLPAAAAVGVLWGLAGVPNLLGQIPDRLAPGSRVRLVASPMLPRLTTASVVGWRADSLLLEVADGSQLTVPLTSLTRIEISRGRKSKVVTGAGIGLLVGAAATAAFLGGFCSDSDTLCESDEVVRAFTIIAPPPTVLGALIGLAIRVERWEAVPVAQPDGAATPFGMRVGLVLRF